MMFVWGIMLRSGAHLKQIRYVPAPKFVAFDLEIERRRSRFHGWRLSWGYLVIERHGDDGDCC